MKLALCLLVALSVVVCQLEQQTIDPSVVKQIDEHLAQHESRFRESISTGISGYLSEVLASLDEWTSRIDHEDEQMHPLTFVLIRLLEMKQLLDKGSSYESCLKGMTITRSMTPDWEELNFKAEHYPHLLDTMMGFFRICANDHTMRHSMVITKMERPNLPIKKLLAQAWTQDQIASDKFYRQLAKALNKQLKQLDLETLKLFEPTPIEQLERKVGELIENSIMKPCKDLIYFQGDDFEEQRALIESFQNRGFDQFVYFMGYLPVYYTCKLLTSGPQLEDLSMSRRLLKEFWPNADDHQVQSNRCLLGCHCNATTGCLQKVKGLMDKISCLNCMAD